MDPNECPDLYPFYPYPTHQPVNGFNGSLHEVFFYAPSYQANPYNQETLTVGVTWNKIDAFALKVAVKALVLGVCLGTMLITLLYVLFVTPQAKRWKLFHSSLLLALLFKTTSLLVVGMQLSSRTNNDNPAYPIITRDYSFAYSSTFLAWRLSGSLVDLLADIATFTCLFVQAKTTLAGLRLSHRTIFFTLTTCLILASMGCVVTHTLNLAAQTQLIITQSHSPEPLFLSTATLATANSVLTALSLGSYCIITLISILRILWTRRILLLHHGSRNTRYDRALALLALILFESLLGPLLLLLMIMLPDKDAGYFRPEWLLLPVVLAVLPFGGLFSGREGEAGLSRRNPPPQSQQDGRLDAARGPEGSNAWYHAAATAAAAARELPVTGAAVKKPGGSSLGSQAYALSDAVELPAGRAGGCPGNKSQSDQQAAPPTAAERELAALDAM